MTQAAADKPQDILSPLERSSEILFGLIMALGSTCTVSVAHAGKAEVRTMLYTALGCNVAWGLVDGIMYWLDAVTERAQNLDLLRRFQSARGTGAQDAIVRDALPYPVLHALRPGDLDLVRQRLEAIPPAPPHISLTSDHYRAAVGVALLVTVSTVPVALPFVFMSDPEFALRTSNAVALVTMFLMGWRLGRCVGVRPWAMATGMVGVGIVCVALTIALGG